MLRCSCHAGLQLEVAKRIVTAARKVVSEHSPLLCYAEWQLDVAKRIVTAARKELGCRSYRRASRAREEVAQIRGCSEKK